MDSRYRFLTLDIPWTQSMPSRDVNAPTRLAEASWRREKTLNKDPGQDSGDNRPTKLSLPLKNYPDLEAVSDIENIPQLKVRLFTECQCRIYITGRQTL